MQSPLLQRMLEELDRLRDPRCHDPHRHRTYITGISHGAMLSGAISIAECARVFELTWNATQHSINKNPWAFAPAEWSPF